MYKRMAALYGLCVFLLAVVMFRVYDLSRGELLAQAAARQSSYTLSVEHVRGGIYDRDFQPLVGKETYTVAAVLPTPDSAAMLLEALPQLDRQTLMEQMEGGKPFLLPLEEPIYTAGVEPFTLPQRYTTPQTAVHLIGYLDGTGAIGVTGIERAYDDLLEQMGGEIRARYRIDAAGQVFQTQPQITGPQLQNLGGVVLTLDGAIQTAAEQALADGVERGAVVVMDVKNGDILAMASCPAYNPQQVALVLEDKSGPLLNRAICAYNVGSTFKLAVAAAALEQGVSRWQVYDCPGWVEVDGQVYRCHDLEGHGEMDMREAIKHSCNVYFIKLAQMVGGTDIREMARRCGFGAGSQLAPGLRSQDGLLTEEEYLASSGELANFGFGQGRLTATPLQIAQLVTAIANGGGSVTPRLVLGTTFDGQTLDEPEPSYATNPVMSSATAALLRGMMVDTVEDGSGKQAKPTVGGAGGKTASAQTGQMDANGEEIVHAWFSGFYPAQNPAYAIVVLAEGGDSGGDVAAPIFRRVAEALALREK